MASKVCLRCISIMTLSVSRAWCGLNSFKRWWIWMNNKLRSSTFSALLGESGDWTNKSIRSKKFTRSEWFNFLNSRLRSKCWGYSRLIPWKMKQNKDIIFNHELSRYLKPIFPDRPKNLNSTISAFIEKSYILQNLNRMMDWILGRDWSHIHILWCDSF